MTPPVCIKHASEVFDAPTADDRQHLERFLNRVERLQDFSFFEQTESQFTAYPAGYDSAGHLRWTFAVDYGSEEAVSAAIGAFREVYNSQNTTSAKKTIDTLTALARSRGARGSDQAISELRELNKAMKQRRKEDPRGAVFEGGEGIESKTLTPEYVIDLWLHGEYLHNDPDKAAALGAEDDQTRELLKLTLHNAMRDYLRYWQHLAAVVREVLALRP